MILLKGRHHVFADHHHACDVDVEIESPEMGLF